MSGLAKWDAEKIVDIILKYVRVDDIPLMKNELKGIVGFDLESKGVIELLCVCIQNEKNLRVSVVSRSTKK